MGVYEILMGKGIIIPIELFKQKFPELDVGEMNDSDMKSLGFSHQLVTLGHDAFESRNKNMCGCMLEGEDRPALDDYIGKELMFIGKYMGICDGELSYYIKAPEVIYSMAGMVQNIAKALPELNEYDTTDIEKLFDVKSAIWTFTNDCCCCG